MKSILIALVRASTLAVVMCATLSTTNARAQRRPHRTTMIPLAQAEQLFEQAARAADDLVHVEIQPGDANGQVRAWDARWSRFVAGLDALSMSATCGDLGEDVECGRRAVESLMCNLDNDLELAREGVYDEILRDSLRDLPRKLRARRVVADEALRRHRERLSCEDVESIWDAQRRLEDEERRGRSRAGEAADAHPNAMVYEEPSETESADETSTPSPNPLASTTSPQPSPAPSASSPTSPLSFEEAERAVRDVIAAIEDLDVVLVDGARAARRRSIADALLLFPAVAAWNARWPNLGPSITRLTSTGCTVADPIRTLTCEVGADILRWSRELESAGTDRNPVRMFERARTSTRRVLNVLRGRLRRADALVRQRHRDPMSRILADG